MYCVEWNTRKARPARKSRDERRPATGRNRKPVQSENEIGSIVYVLGKLYHSIYELNEFAFIFAVTERLTDVLR